MAELQKPRVYTELLDKEESTKENNESTNKNIQRKLDLNILRNKYNVSSMKSTLFSAILLGYWDNLMGPLINKIWIGNKKVAINEDIINYVSNHTLTGELCRQTDTHSIDPKIYILEDLGYVFYSAIFNGQSALGQTVSSLSFIMPYEEFERYLVLQEFIERRVKLLVLNYRVLQFKDLVRSVDEFKDHLKYFVRSIDTIRDLEVPPKVCISNTLFGESDEANDTKLLDSTFLVKVLTSHLQTCCCSVIIGANPQHINLLIRTLSMFSSYKECGCSRLASTEKNLVFTRELYLQGIVKNGDKVEQSIPFKEVFLNTYPVTLIDVDTKSVRQTSPLHEHGTARQKLVKVKLELLLQGLDDSVYEEHNPFNDYLGDDSIMVQHFISELFAIPNKCMIRKNHVDNFIGTIQSKAATLISHIEAKTNYGQIIIGSSQTQQIKEDLNLTSEADFRVILAAAEKLRPNIAVFLLGSVSRRDRNTKKPSVPAIWR